jgi:hypothetical protein
MPATNPRLTITLSPSVAAMLRHLSELTGNSQSSMVADLLQESLPIFERMSKVFEAAKVAQTALSTEMAASLGRAQTKLEAQLGLAMEQFDQDATSLLEVAEAVKRRRRRAGGPPLSNRGVTSTKTSKTIPARKSVKGSRGGQV